MACAKCAESTFWEGETVGKEVKVNGLDAYVAEPSSRTGKAVLLITDVYGWELKNTRLLADKFAVDGFTGVVLDLFKGDNPDLQGLKVGNRTNFLAWRDRHLADTVIPDLDKASDALSAQYGIKSFGAIGFCWGGKFAAILAGTDKVKAAVVNHGSFVTSKDVEAIKQPLLINASDNDSQISREMLAQFQGILDCKKDVPSDVKVEILQPPDLAQLLSNFYAGMEHGWTVKGDANDLKVGPQIVDAYERASGWFQKYL